jgi:hypothetical protein
VNLGGGSFDWKLKVLVLILRVRSDLSATSPFPYALFSPNASPLAHFAKDSSKIRKKVQGQHNPSSAWGNMLKVIPWDM